MRIVLDTNVLVAAFITRGACHELLEHCIVHHEVVVSPHILGELHDVLVQKFGYGEEETDAVVSLLVTRAHIVAPVSLSARACRDPDDDWILATACSGQCDAIVTGDADLTDLGLFEAIRILTPSAFWAWEQSPEMT